MAEKSLQDHHNQGEKDASNGVYNPPPSTNWGDTAMTLFFDSAFDDNAKKVANVEAYRAGHDNGTKQKS